MREKARCDVSAQIGCVATRISRDTRRKLARSTKLISPTIISNTSNDMVLKSIKEDGDLEAGSASVSLVEALLRPPSIALFLVKT